MKISFNSDLHVAFHEAGHIEATYIWGGTVSKVWYQDCDVGKARSSVNHTDDLCTKKPVACGGFAVEWLLFDSGRLIGECKNVLSEQKFQRKAMEWARIDKRGFYLTQPQDDQGFWPGSPFQPTEDWHWPRKSDGPFVNYAKEIVVPVLKQRLEVIERLANQFEKKRLLTQTEIEKIRGC